LDDVIDLDGTGDIGVVVCAAPERADRLWSAPPTDHSLSVPEERLPGGWFPTLATHEVEPERPIEPPP